MPELRISDDLGLPVDAVTQSMAILARRGAGKTYTGSVLVEEAIGAKVPTVVLDPTGAWWGLRSSVNGERPGLPVVIFGGDHGDVPLEPAAGTVLADVVIEHPGAYVIDLSALLSKAAEQRFAADFLERLYRAKKRETGPLLVVVDEADTFAPQRPGPEQTRTLGALESIVRRGRIKGLGDLLITQRAAVLNKNVLTQTEILVAMQTTGPQDRAAIDAWIEGNGTPEQRAEVMGSLASLERGEAWVWSPSFLRILQRVRIRARRTFDSSRTPEAGEAAVAPTTFAKVDLEKLGARIAATIEKQRADDPRELRRRIAQLEAESKARLGIIERRSEPEVRIERVEVPVLSNGQVEQLRDIVGELRQFGERITAAAGGIAAAIDGVQAAPARRPAPVAASAREQHGRNVRGPSRSETEARTLPPAPTPGSDEAPLRPTERAVLAALAQYPQGRSQQQTALLSGYSSTSGGFFGALARLRKSGYIVGSAALLQITDAGRAALGDWEPLPTGPALLDYWLGRLRPTERAVLAALVEAWPDVMSQADVAAKAGYSATSGGFFGALAKLRRLDLIEGGAAALRASDDIAEHRA